MLVALTEPAAVAVAAVAAAGRGLVSGLVPEQPEDPTWNHCPQKIAHAFRSACQGRLPSDHHHCHHEAPGEQEGYDIVNVEMPVHSQGHCSSFCQADPSDASFVAHTDYSDQSGSTLFDSDWRRDGEGMAVRRQSLLLAFAGLWDSLGFQGSHILQGLQGPH